MRYIKLYEGFNSENFVEIIDDLRDICLELSDYGYIVNLYGYRLGNKTISIFDSTENIIKFVDPNREYFMKDFYCNFDDKPFLIQIVRPSGNIDDYPHTTFMNNNIEAYSILKEVLERIEDYMKIYKISTKITLNLMHCFIDFI